MIDKLVVQWRQDYKELEMQDGTKKREKLEKPIWHDFSVSDLTAHSRDHAIALFSTGPAVRAKQGDTRIVNRSEIAEQYKSKGMKVLMFSELQPSQEKFGVVGFI